MTTNAKRYEIARVERSAALLEAANVMHLELGVGSAASRTGVAVTLDNGCSHLLPSAAAPQPARRLSVAFSLPLTLAGRARPARRVRLDPLAVRTDAAHRYFPTPYEMRRPMGGRDEVTGLDRLLRSALR
jgi:hypothetical protein